jgi:predicted RNA-binding Zn-ribbon protein involved in translation (DUF1610 family)
MTKEHDSKIIAVDFDGCLVTDKFPVVGEPIHETIEALKAEQARGAKVILWTCRRRAELEAAADWCAKHGIHLDAVNENLPHVTEVFGEDARKIFANEYWDDRARMMPLMAKKVEKSGREYICPNCGRIFFALQVTDGKPIRSGDYCDSCGQRLDWELKAEVKDASLRSR